MSDKRVCAASGGDSNSETDEPGACESGSPLGAISQGNEKSKLENKVGGSGSGISLTNPSDLGLSRGLGAKPKAGHRGQGKLGNKKDDIWNNPARRSAKSLKGQGQKLAAAEGGKEDTCKADMLMTTATRTLRSGPRLRRGPGSDQSQRGGKSGSERRGGYAAFDFAVAALIFMPCSVILIYDLLNPEASHEENGEVHNFFHASQRKILVICGIIFLSLLALAVVSHRINKNMRSKK
ncbi:MULTISPECIES: hypothetical protein [Candidatus Ichthyocystis]|uniref:hypothetical protein n=1 Tax=Candidatus Ichthyocystis TaxID=2929841 RepID=UPI000B89C2DC|nr:MULTISPECIES: hypothetical protein [Ichthyocystis]